MDGERAGADPAVILGTVAVLVGELLADPHRYSTADEVRAHAAQLRAHLAILRGLERRAGLTPRSDVGEAREVILSRAAPALRRARYLRRLFGPKRALWGRRF